MSNSKIKLTNMVRTTGIYSATCLLVFLPFFRRKLKFAGVVMSCGDIKLNTKTTGLPKSIKYLSNPDGFINVIAVQKRFYSLVACVEQVTEFVHQGFITILFFG